MESISAPDREKCPRCGSGLVSLEWDERVNPREVQDLWHCWNCKSEFITTIASDEKGPSVAEITEPFFTSLVME
jgi:DNA-directed RNA polymerase subunit RPC12/RpoP